jgi:2-C-methyl-D-erythritol 4-phosphate cytidylyltransferase
LAKKESTGVKHRSAIIVAGGKGTRMGVNTPKQFLLLEGKPVIIYALEAFLSLSNEIPVIIVLPQEYCAEFKEFLKKNLNPEKLGQVFVVNGGQTRTLSVFNGLKRLEVYLEGNDLNNSYVAIHDAARPFIQPSLLEKAYRFAEANGNAVICVPVKNSLRMLKKEGSFAVDRSNMYEVQTPQIFPFETIYTAYNARTGNNYTDDASLLESFGHQIFICEGDYENIKITTSEDILLGSLILKKHL